MCCAGLTKRVNTMDKIETIQYKGYDINIYPDNDACNPWEEYDTQPPMIVIHSRDHIIKYGNVDFDYLPGLTRAEIKANIKAITHEFENTYLLAGVRDYMHLSNDGIEAVNTALHDWYTDLNNGDKLEMQARIYKIKGVDCLCASIHGSCQSDYGEVLIVASPEYLKEIGVAKISDRQLESERTLYENWAFGNTYGYEIEDFKDSCWGFYGEDHQESGLKDCAMDFINCHIDSERKNNIKQLKQWLKNKVPLMYRKTLNY